MRNKTRTSNPRSVHALVSVITALMLLVAQRSSAAEIRHFAEPVAGRYIVALSPFTANVPVVASELARTYNGKVLAVWRHALKGFRIELSAENAAKLARDKRVVSMEEDALLHSSGQRVTGTPQSGIPGVSPKSPLPRDPLWHLTRISHRENSLGHPNSDNRSASFDADYYRYSWLNAGVAADGRRVTVYPIDTGVLATHSEFGGRLAGQRPRVEEGFRATEVTDKNAIVPADYVPPDPSPATNPCQNRGSSFTLNDTVPSAHGTAVASLVTGRNVGVADGAVIVSVNTVSCEPAVREDFLRVPQSRSARWTGFSRMRRRTPTSRPSESSRSSAPAASISRVIRIRT